MSIDSAAALSAAAGDTPTITNALAPVCLARDIKFWLRRPRLGDSDAFDRGFAVWAGPCIK